MRYVEGGDLGQLIEQRGRLEGEQALVLLGQVAMALDAAHAAGLLHRDVKPGNILVDGSRAWLADFGLAKHASTVNSLSRDNSFAGTVAYIAPEQIQGGDIDSRADVYSLGCVLFEALAGRQPFERDNDLAVVFAHLREPPPSLSLLRPDLPESLDRVIERALAKNPDQRYPTAAELMEDAGQAIRGDEVVVATPDAGMLRTFLICDVRGYTRYTQEHGDEAAAELASTFAELVRSVVRRYEGRLIELRGDEALVTFESSRQALRAALGDPAAGGRRGLTARRRHRPRCRRGSAGGHRLPGWRVEHGGAAVLASGAGQVLATEGVTHLAHRVEGARYLSGRLERLKGIERPVRVVEIVPHHRGDALVRRVRRHTHGRRWVPLAGVAVAVAGLAVALFVAFGARTGVAAFRPGVVLLDIKTRHQVGFIRPSAIASPAFPMFSGGHIWMMNFTPSSYVEIDPATGKVLTQFAPPNGSTDSATYQPYAVVGNSLWTGSGHDLVRVDTDLGKEVDRFHLDRLVGDSGTVEGVAVGGGLVWVGRDVGSGQIVALDPATGRVRYRFGNIAHHIDIAYGDGLVWAADFGGLTLIDPSTKTVTPVAGITSTSQFIITGGGFAWTSDPATGVVYKVDKRGQIAATYHTGLGANNLSYSDGVVWVANSDVGTVTGINAISGSQSTQRFGHPVGVAAAGAGILVTALQSGPTIDSRFAALGDNIVTLFSQQGALGEGNEPALNWNAAAFQVDYATCANLLRYPDAPAPAGLRLQPEVAAVMPTVSADGRTYTFTIRRGYRFSPPTNQRLTAETFRYSIERALSPRLGKFTPGPYLVDDIEGEQAFRSGKASTISGLRTSGSRLEITLTRASPTFRKRLATPFFCPVPTGTPFVPGAPLRGSGLGDGYIPSAGPYYVADYNNDKYVILKRNPNYHGPRPHRLDAIALREGVDAGYAVDHVQHGGWDGIVSSGHNGSTPIDPLLAPTGAIASQYHKSAVDGDQYVTVPLPGDGVLALNARRAPFADPAIRRAAALAIDSKPLAAAWSAIPAAQLLPPMFPGAHSEVPSPARQQDLERARRLMNGRKVDAVMSIFSGCDQCSEAADAIKADLSRIGILVTVRSDDDPFTAAARPGSNTNILDTGIYDYPVPDSAGWLQQLLVNSTPSGWLPAQVRHDVIAANRIQGSRRQPNAAALADRLTTRIFPVVPYGIAAQGEFFAPTLGCRVFPPFGYGVDLAGLCLKQH